MTNMCIKSWIVNPELLEQLGPGEYIFNLEELIVEEDGRVTMKIRLVARKR